MSGICGWFASIPPPSPADLIEAMARTLCSPVTGQPERYASPSCGLAAVPLNRDSGTLYRDDALWIAYDGMPYFAETSLKDIAAAHGTAAAIGTSYRRRGMACLGDIHGPFSVAIADLAAERVILAVDRLGIRPLCLAHAGAGIVFGATTDSVIAHPGVARDIDPQAVYDYLYFHMVPSPRTIYQGLEKLLPGQCALFENGRLAKHFYWEMAYCDRHDAPQAQLAEEFRGLLRQNVRRALSSPHAKTGNFLSGGTDSSTLAGIVTEVTGGPVDTYSIGFDIEGYDESHYAGIAVKHFGTRHHNYYVTPQDVVAAIPLIARAYDEPFGNASAVPTYYCAKLAKEDGVDLMIAGDGGDELFAGNIRYAKQKAFELYYGIPPLLRHFIIEPLTIRLPGTKSLAPLRKLQSYISQAKVPLPDRLESYNFLHRSPLRDIFQSTFLETIDLDEPLENMREVYTRTQANTTLHRMLHLDLKNTLADNDLRKVNRMCEAAGTRVRYPLLDEAMVEFSGRVPPDLKIRGFALRYFFKDSLRGFLPPEILKKSKHGFGLPFGLWLNQHKPLRELVGDTLQSLRQREYLNPHYVNILLDEQHREHAGYYGVMIWVLVMLEQWLQSRSGSV
jgi:asparagine synthase (glutamine-hydrolysing)